MKSKLILGTAQLGMDYGINNRRGKITKPEAFEILEYAYDNGIEFLDTAPVYGDAQQIIGEFHQNYSTKIFKIISKIPAGFPLEQLETLIDEFLLEMNISSIEVLHFHSVDDYLNTDKRLLNSVISNLKKANKVVGFGVSIYENNDADQLLKDKNIDVVQLPFNLLDNLNQRQQVIKALKLSGKKIHSRSAFLQGLFMMELSKLPFEELKPAIREIQEISLTNKIPIEALALNYCINQETIDNVLIGVDSLYQLKTNINNSLRRIDTSILNQIDLINITKCEMINPTNWHK